MSLQDHYADTVPDYPSPCDLQESAYYSGWESGWISCEEYLDWNLTKEKLPEYRKKEGEKYAIDNYWIVVKKRVKTVVLHQTVEEEIVRTMKMGRTPGLFNLNIQELQNEWPEWKYID